MPSIHRRNFFVGGAYAGPPGSRVMHGQMHVEMLTPDLVTHRYPLVLICGKAQTATGWMTTPDGRQGWAEWFAEHGWRVCVVDQPARGRSAWQPEWNGAVKPLPVPLVENLFTAPEDGGSYPQAQLHTRWPGGKHKGHAGDPVFDQFYASQVASLDNPESERLMQAAGAALLDEIGPAILLTHSQGGLFGWLMADARPGKVMAIMAVEPGGPPYQDDLYKSGADRISGLTTEPLTYDPPVSVASPLQFEQQAEPDAPELARCWLQKGTPRRLVNLANVPVLVLTAEASYHAMFDHCTARYLSQAGVSVQFIRLQDVGITGNGHMLMLEENSLDIAAFLDAWLSGHMTEE
ncbi:alpha/beta hydrolase [Dyella flava]|uniref:Alpha/beta fold hydrolase n=1 Tax=Dyella flava TaxID=1920170 RepID=A0ABS2K1M4_9GAMM|nr:alpha/beta hydrolase [Dyella flava]MBM7124525.1 alpha/beta fold hydrolase [Dyella flava]GLQ51807.1 hypothetical protein GCM10010872_32560 [Dyella flava]